MRRGGSDESKAGLDEGAAAPWDVPVGRRQLLRGVVATGVLVGVARVVPGAIGALTGDDVTPGVAPGLGENRFRAAFDFVTGVIQVDGNTTFPAGIAVAITVDALLNGAPMPGGSPTRTVNVVTDADGAFSGAADFGGTTNNNANQFRLFIVTAPGPDGRDGADRPDRARRRAGWHRGLRTHRPDRYARADGTGGRHGRDRADRVSRAGRARGVERERGGDSPPAPARSDGTSGPHRRNRGHRQLRAHRGDRSDRRDRGHGSDRRDRRGRAHRGHRSHGRSERRCRQRGHRSRGCGRVPEPGRGSPRPARRRLHRLTEARRRARVVGSRPWPTAKTSSSPTR